MFDTHYDLLSIVYYSILRNDDTYLKSVVNYLNEKNVSGLIANLYFMNLDEMREELGDSSIVSFDVLQIFKMVKDKFDSLNLNANILYSIEGCDFIKNENELESLYDLGLDSFLLVWNNENKYGSGCRTNKGLTKDGKRFLNKAINLGMGIDLSHANENTFFDMIDVIKSEQNSGKKVICFASHSNIRSLYDSPRNLTDKQLMTLKEVGGKLGIVSYISFLADYNDINIGKNEYIKHIKYAVDIMGIDNVMVSSDDMGFEVLFANNPHEYFPLYNYATIKDDLKRELKKHFSDEEIEKIMFKNAMTIYEGIKNARFMTR